MKPVAAVRAEFDLIADAIAARGGRDRLTSSERYLLRRVPRSARRALDVGCGDGRLARALAARGIATLGIDASPRMIALARARSDASSLLEFRLADVSTDAPPPAMYDVVLSVALAHHLPLEQVVRYLRACVAPGGTLLIQDIVDRSGLRYLPLNGIAWCAKQLRRALGDGPGSAIEALYEAHGAGERYLRLAEIAQAYRTLLPGCRIHHHLDWRYSVAWSVT